MIVCLNSTPDNGDAARGPQKFRVARSFFGLKSFSSLNQPVASTVRAGRRRFKGKSGEKPARFPPLCTGDCAAFFSATGEVTRESGEGKRMRRVRAGSQETLPARLEVRGRRRPLTLRERASGVGHESRSFRPRASVV